MAQHPAVKFPGMLRRLLLSTSALLPAAIGVAQAQAPNAVPTGGQVTAGQATISQSGNNTQITQGSNRAVVDWQRFDVGRNSSVNFTQPNAQSWTLNRVNTPDPSMIAGRITANGGVAIVNQSGVVFAGGSQVNVGSLIATAANITNQNFMAGRMVFDGAPREGARVENHGSITVADRGLAALVAPGVANSGTIRARLGSAVMAGAETYRLDLAGDGMLSIDVTQAVRRAPNGGAALVTNSGVVEAQGGQVILTAHAASGLVEAVVRNTGRVAGRNVTVTGQGGNVEIASGSVSARGGSVEITAPGSSVTVGPQARVSASSRAGGGTVQLGGATTAAVRVEGRVSARGTGANATGGRVAVQARDSVTLAPTAVVNASGSVGGGTVLLGTTGVGRAQTMARETRLEAGALVHADATANGNGGLVVVNSAQTTVMSGTLSARGGALGGNGGFIEVSAMGNIQIDGRILLSAPRGAAGTFLLDPVNIEIRTAAAGGGEDAVAVPPAGDFNFNANTGGNLTAIITTADLNASAGNIILQAQNNITVTNTVNKAAGNLTLTADTGTITISAGVTLGAGDLTLSSAAGIAVNGALNAANISLQSGGAIAGASAVTTGGILTVRGAGGAGEAGSLSLTGVNAIATLDALTTGVLSLANGGTALAVTQARASAGDVTLGNTGANAITLNGAVRGDNINLNTDNNVSGLGVVTTPGTLRIRGAAAGFSQAESVILTAANEISTLDVRSTSVINVTNGAFAMTVTGAVTNLAIGVTTLGNTGPNALSIVNSVHGFNVNLNSSGAITSSLDLRAAGTLTVRGAGGAGNAGSLSVTGVNAIGTLDALTTGNLSVANGGTALAVTQAQASNGDVTLGNTGANAITLNGAVRGNNITVNTDNTVSGLGVVTTPGTFRARGAAGTDLSQIDSVILTAANQIATLDARGTTTINVTNGAFAMTVARAQTNLVIGAVTLGNTGVNALTLTGAVSGLNVNLNSSGAISGTGGLQADGTLTVRGAGGVGEAGSLSLTGANPIATLDALTTGTLSLANGGTALAVTQAQASAGDVSLGNTGANAITLNGAVRGNNIALNSDGAISGAGVVTTPGTLTVRGAGGAGNAASLSLTGVNAISTLDALTNGVLSLANGGTALTVTQARASAGDVSLGNTGANAITLNGAVRGNNIALNSDGAISGAGIVTTPNALTVRGAAGGATAAASLDLNAANLVTTLDANTTGNINFLNAQSLSVARATASNAAATVTLSASAGTLSLPATGVVSTGAGGIIRLSANAMTFTAGSAITAPTGTVFLTPFSNHTDISIGGAGGLVLDAAELRAALFTSGGDRRVTNLRLQTSGTGAVTFNTALNVGDGVTTGADRLQIWTDGAVTQAAAAVITAPLLEVRGNLGLAATEAPSITLGEANLVGTLDARATNALFFGSGQAFNVTQARSASSSVTIAGTGVTSLPAANAISASTFALLRPLAANTPFEVATVAAVAGSNSVLPAHLANITAPVLSLQSTGTANLTVTNAFTSPSATLELVGQGLVLNGTVTGTAAGTVRLVMDTGLTGASGVTVPGAGTIEVLPRTTGGNFTLGGAGAGINIPTAQFALLDAQTLVIGGMGVSFLGGTGTANTGNITVTGDVTRGAGTTLRLRAGGSVTQTAGVITAPNLSGFANGGDFTLSALGATPTANVITTIVADTPGGTGIAASGNLRLDTNVALLTVNAPLRSGTRERDAGTGAVLGAAVITNGTTLSLFADDLALAAMVTAPAGTIQINGFSTRRDVTLGGAGALSLDTVELALIGDAANATNVLRFGRVDPAGHNIGSVAVLGPVGLRTRVNALELLASTDLNTRTITGAGVIDVASLSAVAGGDISLTGANTVTTLARVTDTPIGPLTGVGNVSLWSGVASGVGLGGPGLLSFTNAGNLTVAGSVLASGANTLTLTTTAGGTLGIGANIWVAAEGGPVTVNAAGAITNAGTITGAPIANDAGQASSVTSGAGGNNTGVIALGFNAAPTTVTGFATNSGYILADQIGPMTTNSGRIVTSTAPTSGVALTENLVGGQVIGRVLNPGAAFTNRGDVVGSVRAGTVENVLGARILGASVEADTGTVTNNGTILTATLRAQGDVLQQSGEIGAGSGTATPILFNLTSAEARAGALAITANATVPVPVITESRAGSLTVESTAGNITQSGGTFTAPAAQSVSFTSRAGEVTQTGGSITAPGIAVSAATSVTLDQVANSFTTIATWVAPPQLNAGTAATALAVLGAAPTFATYGIAAGTGAVRLQTNAAALTVNGGIRAGTDLRVLLPTANGNLVLNAPLRSGTAGGTSLMTLVADNMAINTVAGSMTLAAPGGTIRLMSQTAGRAITLGGAADVAGTLTLGSAELAAIGGTAADGLTTPTSRLRIGSDTAGAISIVGDALFRADVGPTFAASLTAPIPERVSELELVSNGAITQTAGVKLGVAAIALRSGAASDILLHDGPAQGAESRNTLDRTLGNNVLGGFTDGTLDAAGTARAGVIVGRDLALTTWRSFTLGDVNVGRDAFIRVAPGANPGPAGVLTTNSLAVPTGRSITLIADDMNVTGNLTAPGGSLRLMPFSSGRAVALGANTANSLALSTVELALFGEGGTAASILRLGRASPVADAGTGYTALNGNTVGNVAVSGAASLRTGLGGDRVQALEIFANGTVTGSGALDVANLGLVAGGLVAIPGANRVDRLAPITEAYTIAAPYTNAGGVILGQSLGNLAIWAGANNAQGVATPTSFGFINTSRAPELTIAGSVLTSGTGNLSIANTGNVVVGGAGVWVVAETGTASVGATGTMINNGNIISGDLSGGTVSASGGLTNNRTIALGRSAGNVTGLAANNGFILAGGTVSGTAFTNAAGAGIRAGNVTGIGVNNGNVLATNVSGPLTVNTGEIGVTSTLSITGDFTNSNEVIAGTMTVTGNLTNASTIFSSSVSAGSVTNQAGAVIGSGVPQTTGADNYANATLRQDAVAGTVKAPASVTVNPVSAPALTLASTSGDIVNLGTIQAPGGAMVVNAARDFLQNGGSVSGASSIGITTGRDFTQNLGSITAPTAATLSIGRDASFLAGGFSTGTGFGLTATGNANFGGTALSIGSSGSITAANIAISAGSIGATGGLTLQTGGSLTQTGGAMTASGALTATAGADITQSAGTRSAGTSLALNATRDIQQSGGTLSAGTTLTLTAGRDAVLSGGSSSAASLGSQAQGSSADRDFLWNGGNANLPTIYAVTAGRDLGLRNTTTPTTVLGALLAGRDLNVQTTAGSLTFRNVSLRAVSGTLGLQSSSDLGVFNSTLSSGGAMTLRAAGTLTSNPSSFTADSISLVSGSALSFTQATMTAAQSLTAEVGGDITFLNSSLRASTSPAENSAAFRTLRLAGAGRLALTSSNVTADRVELVAGGFMTTAGSAFRIGTGLLLSARGGVGQPGEAPTTVQALDTARIPLVIFDTRSGVYLMRLPDALTAGNTDRQGVAFGQQTWQVPGPTTTGNQLLFGVNDGAPTPPTNAAAGSVYMNLTAGSSPIFLLLNGGTATGSLTAGRLGLYGLPGSSPLPGGRSVDLFGQLGGLGAESAARFGALGGARGTSPAPSDLQLYRFNNCVVASINCVVPTFLQIPTTPAVNTLILGAQQPTLDDRDVLLPNVAEKDF